MNTLAYIAAFPALGWLANFLLTGNRMDELLFASVIVVVAWAMIMTWVAIKEDQNILS